MQTIGRQSYFVESLSTKILSTSMNAKQLTAKQERFCEEYLIDLNATKAAIRAGYSADSAKSIGHENLTKPDLQERVAGMMAERSRRCNFTSDDLFNELVKVGTANMLDFITVQSDGSSYVDLSNLTRDQAAALSEVSMDVVQGARDGDEMPREVRKVKIKLHSKLQALVELGKHLGVKAGVDITSNGTNPSVKFMIPDNGRGPDVGTLVEQLAASDPGYLEWKQKQMTLKHGE